ncbi:MAG TPA: hypothetical protein VGV92_01420 [Gammaproteobacteria bacterium]|nr:hypothetical protein [Gammaproteobacteria bacterium]
MPYKIKIPKILYPSVITKKEKDEANKLIKAAFRICPPEEAIRLVIKEFKKAKHHHGHQHH